MAITKAKRSVHPSKGGNQQSAKARNKTGNPLDRFARLPRIRFFLFRQVKGKTVARVEFSASVDHHDIGIWFTDKTSLNFSIEAGFTLKSQYSDWTSGEQRVIRRWKPIHSRI